MRRRIRIILLFPVTFSFFLASWILYSLEEGRTGNKQLPKRKTIPTEIKESNANSDDFKMGLIEETAEEQKI